MILHSPAGLGIQSSLSMMCFMSPCVEGLNRNKARFHELRHYGHTGFQPNQNALHAQKIRFRFPPYSHCTV